MISDATDDFFLRAALELYKAAKEENDKRATMDITRLDLAIGNFGGYAESIELELRNNNNNNGI